ncbi:MAG: hypothetical protein K8S99_04800 [Planctomycetes bacterium]|nr:hypothetical protein [Planctomycetota bacterium]
MAREHNNFKAGLFVLTALALGVAAVFILSDFERLFLPRQKVLVHYFLADGLQGLKGGAAVTLGDQPIGEVIKIIDELDAGKARVTGKIVTVSIPARYQIYQNAVVELNAPPLGSGTKLNFRSVGEGAAYDGKTPLEGTLAGSSLAKNFIREAGIGEEQREQIRTIIANVANITTNVRKDLPDLTQRIRVILDKAGPVMDKVDASLDNLKAASADLKTILADAKDRRTVWFDRVDSITGKADKAVGTVQGIVSDKEPAIRNSIDNLESITKTAREKTMVQISDALDKAIASLENFKKLSEDARGFVTAQRPVLERALANAQITTDQLKLTAIELRRSPWRLLYAPGDNEIANDNLYDAARSFAQAAGALDAAVESLRAISNDKTANPEQVKLMLDHLESLYKKYGEAEARFWETLKAPPGPGSPKK